MKSYITTYQPPATFDEACEQVRDLQEKADACIHAIRKQGKDLIVYRFLQGRAVHHALPMERARHYGDRAVGVMADKAGVSPTVLYRALEFYRHPQFKGSETRLLAWMEEVEEEKGTVTWSYCRNFAQKALPESPENAEKKLRREIRKLEIAVEGVEYRAIDLEREVMRYNGQLKDEGLGVIAKAREVASDTRHLPHRLLLEKPARLENPAYLAYIRSQDCLACRAPAPCQPHHLDRGGMGTKGPDAFTVPLCGPCHGKLHDVPEWEFWDKVVGTNPWKAVAERMLAFYEGGALPAEDEVPVDFEYDE